MLPSAISHVAPAPANATRCSSPHMIFWVASSRRLGIRSGRIPTCIEYSAIRDARFAERTAMNVDAASARVPTAVASDATTVQSTMTETLSRAPRNQTLGTTAYGMSMFDRREVTLRSVTAGNRAALEALSLPPHQLAFVGSVADAFSEA